MDTLRLSRIPRSEAGFTLVELMVVVLIVGLLATVVMMNVLPNRDRAMKEKARGDWTANEALDFARNCVL